MSTPLTHRTQTPVRDRTDSRHRRRQAIQLIAADDEAEDDLSWQQKLRQRLTRWLLAGCGVSLLAHAVVMIACGMIVLGGGNAEQPRLTTRFSETDAEQPSFESVDVDLLKLPEAESVSAPNMREFIPAGMEPALSTLDSAAESEAGQSFGFRMPSGGKAVTQGSFTAWTVPEDPKPRQDYLIVIQIKLPEKIKNYRKEDLTGFLEGDDGYETPLGNYRGRNFPRKYYGRFDEQARQFSIKIPGGAAKVKDLIRVESKVLKEKQVLVIDF